MARVEIGNTSRVNTFFYAIPSMPEGQKLTPNVEGYYYLCEELDVQGTKKTVYTIKTTKGELLTFWANKVLESRFEKIAIGTYVYVDYLGKVKAKSGVGQPYANYAVAIDDAIAPMSDNEEEVSAVQPEAPVAKAAPATAPKKAVAKPQEDEW
jgi:hypothetical protein